MNIFGNGSGSQNRGNAPPVKVGNARLLYKLIRDFTQSVQPYEDAIRYQVKPDERFDMTVVSQQVYGNRDEVLTVMASAGLDSVEDRLPDVLLTMPTATQLLAIKQQAGF